MPAHHARFVFGYLPLCSVLLLASPVQAKDYASCLNEKLQGITHDAAVKAITEACRAQYPDKAAQPIKVSSNIAVPLSEVRALTPEEVYEGHIATMYKTTSRVNQEVAARSLLQRNPNVITEDFRFLEAHQKNHVASHVIYRLVEPVEEKDPQIKNLDYVLYHTYGGQITPDIEVKAFNALIYTLYRDDKRYSANGGNNAEMAGLQAKQLHIYQNGSKEEREALFAGLKTVFDGMDKRYRTNVQVVAKALLRNISEISRQTYYSNKDTSILEKNSFNFKLNLNNFDIKKEDLITKKQPNNF